MIRVALCDDEESARAWLRALVERQGVDCQVGEYADGASYLADGIEYDILLLDIGLKGSKPEEDGGEGLELARRIRGMELGRQPVIIFVTGYRDYVYEAFDVDAFHYLVKPVDERKFAEVFGRALSRVQEGERQRRKTLVVRQAGASRAIPLENIYYLESQNHKILLHMKDGILEYYGKLETAQKELEGQFARIHKGYLVNLSYVEGYSRTQVALANGQSLMISKYKYEDFVKAYLQWMR